MMTKDEIEAEAVRVCRRDERERMAALALHRRAAREAHWRANPTADATYEDFLAPVGGVAREGER